MAIMLNLSHLKQLALFCVSCRLFVKLFSRYIVLATIFSLANWILGAPPKFFGSLGNDQTIKVETHMKAPSTLFSITVTFTTGTKEPKIVHLKKPVETWFNLNGILDTEAFYKDLQLLSTD